MARIPIRPGELLRDEQDDLGLTAAGWAEFIGTPPKRLYQIVAGKRSVTADTTLRLGQYFGMSAQFWMNL